MNDYYGTGGGLCFGTPNNHECQSPREKPATVGEDPGAMDVNVEDLGVLAEKFKAKIKNLEKTRDYFKMGGLPLGSIDEDISKLRKFLEKLLEQISHHSSSSEGLVPDPEPENFEEKIQSS